MQKNNIKINELKTKIKISIEWRCNEITAPKEYSEWINKYEDFIELIKLGEMINNPRNMWLVTKKYELQNSKCGDMKEIIKDTNSLIETIYHNSINKNNEAAII